MSNSIIVLNGKKTSSRDILKALIHLPGYEISAHFQMRGTFIPAKKVRKIVKSYCDQKLPALLTQKFLPAELQDKLKYYNSYTLFQYCNLIQTSAMDVDLKVVRYRLWEYLLANRDKYDLQEFDILKLINTAYGYVNKICEPFLGFYHGLVPSLADYEGEVDGVDVSLLDDALINGASNGELRNFAKNNGIPVPSRITKEQMIDKLISQIKVSAKVIEEIKLYSAIRLEQFAKENGCSVSSELKKEDIIDIIYDNFERVTIEKDMEYVLEYGGPITEQQKKQYKEAQVNKVEIMPEVQQSQLQQKKGKKAKVKKQRAPKQHKESKAPKSKKDKNGKNANDFTTATSLSTKQNVVHVPLVDPEKVDNGFTGVKAMLYFVVGLVSVTVLLSTLNFMLLGGAIGDITVGNVQLGEWLVTPGEIIFDTVLSIVNSIIGLFG